jgi:hypothetical protein
VHINTTPTFGVAHIYVTPTYALHLSMGSEKQEKTWNEPTNRTIYQWSETSKTKNGVPTIRQSTWTKEVRNRMRQKAGENQAYQAYEKGAEKWRKENITRKGKGDISEEGKELLEVKEIWVNPPFAK